MLESGICPVRCAGRSAGESRYSISVRMRTEAHSAECGGWSAGAPP